MRGALTFVLLAVIGMIALCPVFGCFSVPGAHPCCPRHHVPFGTRDCPTMALERAQVTAPVTLALPVAALAEGLLPQPGPTTFPSVEPIAPSHDIILTLRVLRI